MKLEVKRVAKRSTYTIGRLYINGVYFCDTLEDKDRGLKQSDAVSSIKKIKVPNHTAIPTGFYKVIVNKSPKFGRMLPRLLNVPGFEGILIHRGNTDKDTSGCIIVGENKVISKVINSTKYEELLVDILLKAKSGGEEITIDIN